MLGWRKKLPYINQESCVAPDLALEQAAVKADIH